MSRDDSKEPRAAHVNEVLQQRAQSLAQEANEEVVEDLISVLLFRLGEEWYAVNVEDVREIYQEYVVTPIPCVPDYILGVVNIRGEIISVTDIARMMRLGAFAEDEGQATAIVIQNDDCTSAIVVDEIGDILDVPRDAVEPPLSTMDRSQAEFIAGSIFIDGRLIGLVNKDRVLDPITADTN
ncbi:MAG: chemotaxis protein CheW [Actinomycetota bacterium]|nr:chemotaxis protein CheW [Actinomycetota bacterium]